MNNGQALRVEEIDKLYEQLDREAREGGYHLNQDLQFFLVT